MSHSYILLIVRAERWRNAVSLSCSFLLSVPLSFLCLRHHYNSAGGVMFSGCPCVNSTSVSVTRSLWAQYQTNLLGKFRQIYNIAALGGRDEMIRFWSQRSKVKVMTRPNLVENLLLLGSFSHHRTLNSDRMNWIGCVMGGCFSAKEITPLASSKLYCLVTEAHRCK